MCLRLWTLRWKMIDPEFNSSEGGNTFIFYIPLTPNTGLGVPEVTNKCVLNEWINEWMNESSEYQRRPIFLNSQASGDHLNIHSFFFNHLKSRMSQILLFCFSPSNLPSFLTFPEEPWIILECFLSWYLNHQNASSWLFSSASIQPQPRFRLLSCKPGLL